MDWFSSKISTFEVSCFFQSITPLTSSKTILYYPPDLEKKSHFIYTLWEPFLSFLTKCSTFDRISSTQYIKVSNPCPRVASACTTSFPVPDTCLKDKYLNLRDLLLISLGMFPIIDLSFSVNFILFIIVRASPFTLIFLKPISSVKLTTYWHAYASAVVGFQTFSHG